LQHPERFIVDDHRSRFLFLFFGFSLGCSIMMYVGRVIRSLRKSDDEQL